MKAPTSEITELLAHAIEAKRADVEACGLYDDDEAAEVEAMLARAEAWLAEVDTPDPVPAVVEHDEDGRPVDLVCPCGGAIVEHDGAERWNPVSYEPADGELRHGIVVHQGQDDFHTIAFECESCGREIELPAGIVIDWI